MEIDLAELSLLRRHARNAPRTSRGRSDTHRKILFDRQRGLCFYCAKPTMWVKWSVDHVQPRSRQGSNGLKNKVGCCWACNGAKANMTLDEFLNTDYLTDKRRESLGRPWPAEVKFRVAKKGQKERIAGAR